MNEANRESRFVRDLLAEGISDELREASLQRMVTSSKKRFSRRRVLRRLGTSIALIAFSLLMFVESRPKQELGVNSVVASMLDKRVIEGTPIRVMTDEELFALFPGQSVGLVGANDEYRLVFLGRQELGDGSEPSPILD